MTTSLNQEFEAYLPVYDAIPEEWSLGRQFLVEQLKRISNAVNVREIGWFLDEELLSGKQLFSTANSSTNQQFRSVLRKVIDFGSLPNAGTKSVPHSILFDVNFTLISLWGAATDPVNFIAIQIPFASPTLNENIKLTMDATNINITTAINYSTYTRCLVTAEYVQEL